MAGQFRIMAKAPEKGELVNDTVGPSNWLDRGVEGVRGALSSVIPFIDEPDTSAGRFGTMAGTALGAVIPYFPAARGMVNERNALRVLNPPQVNSIKKGPAIRELVDLLRGFNPAPIEGLEDFSKVASTKIDTSLAPVGGGNIPKPAEIELTHPNADPNHIKDLKKSFRVVGSPSTSRAPELQDLFMRQEKARQSLIPDEKVHAVRSVNEIKDVVPAAPDAGRQRAWTPLSNGGGTSGAFSQKYKGPNIKVNPDMVRAIRAAKAGGKSFDEVASQYPHIKKETLRDAFTGNSWSWVK